MNDAPGTTWRDLEPTLAVALQALGGGEMLILERRRGQRLLQVYARPDGGFHAEVASNQFLPAEEQLGMPEILALHRLGWLAPTGGGCPNHHQEIAPPQAAARLAALVAGTFEEALEVAAPVALQYRAFNEGGVEVTLPGLHGAGVLAAKEVREAERFTKRCCPRCGSPDVDLGNAKAVLACSVVGEPLTRVTAPLACKRPGCETYFYWDGRYLSRYGARTLDTPGYTQMVAIRARDLEQVELGPDGALCLAYLGGSSEAFLKVEAADLPRAIALLQARLGGTPPEGAPVGARAALEIVQRAFAERIVTDRSGFADMLGKAGIPVTTYSWP